MIATPQERLSQGTDMSLHKRLPSMVCPSWLLTLLVSLYFVVVFNTHFLSRVSQLHGQGGAQGAFFVLSLSLLLWALFNLLFTLIALPKVLKPVVILLLMISSVVSYFMNSYNILIDKTMLQNAIETDLHESLELMNLHLWLTVFVQGVIPSAVVARLSITYGSLSQFLLSRSLTIAGSLALIGCTAVMFYQDYSSLFRNNRYVRDMIVPVNYLHALNGYIHSQIPEEIAEIKPLGTDARQTTPKLASHKRQISVLVVGETARAGSFSLFGYERQTNPELSKLDVAAFSNVHSCGTSTAVSVPCMFSGMGRDDYQPKQASASENLLDVISHAGLRVIWLDNNSGCKGVCERVENSRVAADQANVDCSPEGECYDLSLLKQMQHYIDTSREDLVFVLHQKGSHGPSYFLRTPESHQTFKPICQTNQLQECSRQEIINAYDNTILYTDHFLAQVIGTLQKQSDTLNSSMLYVSDHGESLGEGNLYLHGIPYFMAPEEQTRVPMIFWMSEGYGRDTQLDYDCVNQKTNDAFSHDNLFHSMLGLLSIKTSVYQQQQDIFASCRSQSKANQALAISEKQS